MTDWRTWVSTAALWALTGTTGVAQAALVSLGDGTVKDTNTNLIWLQNWNVNGLASQSSQAAWAASLDFAGSSDWVLPEISQYEALFSAYGDLTQLVEFTNVQGWPGVYWSNTSFLSSYWYFNPRVGSRFDAGGGLGYYAVAVRNADAATSNGVPTPPSLALALLALGAAACVQLRRG
jgi:hypothetical protein